jgi:CheY-like chemotaxis protein
MKTILSVDDGEDDAFFLDRAFKHAQINCKLVTVPSVAAAKEYLSGTGPYSNRYDHPFPAAVLLDIKMPEYDGFHLLEWIRSQPELNPLPVIILSCSDAPKDIELAYEKGANSYLVKPSSYQDLKKDLPLFMHYWLDLNHSPESCI